MDLADVGKLPAAEKLKLVTKLWDEIAASGEPIVVPPDLLAEAQQRAREIDADPSQALDDEELWRRVDG